jgi:hypothetical protein
MALATEVILSGVTKAQYDEVRAKVGWLDEHPAGGMAHVAWWEGDDNHNWDVWESEAAFAAFGADRLGPALAAVGITVEPTVVFHDAHEVFLPNALTLT